MALSGDVKALIQAENGHVLAGTNNSARIYRSIDNGQTWTQSVALGSGSDSVNALAKTRGTGYIYAAVSGSSVGQGIWRSDNYGVTWSKVFSHPNNTGYLDVTTAQTGSKVSAVGFAVTSAFNSPVIHSTDRGSTWSYVSVPHYNQKHLSIASYPDPVLATAYPNEAYANVFAFFGTDSFYTMLGGIRQTVPPTVAGFGTVGGGAGNGGLDMVSFLVKNSNGSFYRRALWAVKSSVDITDTSIWQWPASPTNASSFVQISTYPDKLFNVMYVDPVDWQVMGAERTVWAGANGEILVSYNSGLSWAVATTAPSGQIYSFVRTTSGVLIAGGASGEIFLFGGSGSEGGGNEEPEEPPTEPEDPDIIGVVTSRFLGRTATCENEVFTANKFSFSNVTHVFHYNGVNYSNLQFSIVPPYEFLGSTASVNKAAYFGSKTNDSNVPGGTFSSLVFDLSREAQNITITWEYYNGSSWSTLTVQDNTEQFKTLGVNSVSWQIPSNWATTTVNGVTGYWVRARISAVSSSPQTPEHDNRYIYTSLLPYIEIAVDQIEGDLPAIGRIKWHNQSIVDVERSICGLRSVDRGTNFNSFINISDVQTPFGLTISKGSQTGVDWQTDKSSPTNRSLLISYSSSGDLNKWNDLASITLSTTVAREYHGYYRALLRCFYNHASSRNWNLRIQLRFGSGGSRLNTQTVYPTTIANWEVLDFGQLAISTRQAASLAGSMADEMKIVIQGYCTNTSRPLTLYDLILIPIDEWAIDARIPDLEATGSPEIDVNDFLDIDSISNPKIAISAYNRSPAGLIISRYQNINNGPVILQKNKAQRLWFLNASYENGYWKAYPETIGTVQVYKQQQYLGFRGSN